MNERNRRSYKVTRIHRSFDGRAKVVLLQGDAVKRLKGLPSGFAKLVVTSPPYNIGKEYESRVELSEYLDYIECVAKEIYRVLHQNGSICWQVGNFIDKGEVHPLDIVTYPLFKRLGLHLRNRIVWHFEHGLHTNRRFSGRYETILWFTKNDDYTFNLDPVRVPSKYPGKRQHKIGPKYGQPSGNPLGKNPSDVWRQLSAEWDSGFFNVPNVKANHPEKTNHVCQFPIELAERCILATTSMRDWVLDPFVGAGSSIVAALKNGRRCIGIDREKSYLRIAKERIRLLDAGELPYREIGKPVFQPTGKERVATIPEEWRNSQIELINRNSQ